MAAQSQARSARPRSAVSKPRSQQQLEWAALRTLVSDLGAIRSGTVEVEHFTAQGPRTVFAALELLASTGEPSTTRQDLELALGSTRVDDVTADLVAAFMYEPDPSSLDGLRRAAVVREALRARDHAIVEMEQARESGEPLHERIAAFDAARRALAALEKGEPQVPPFALLFEAITTALKPVGLRLRSGFPTLDEATRGGIPCGRVLIAAGAPGAGKSTLSVQLADTWERAGAAVVYLAADEPAEGIITRFGQLDGFSRDALEGKGDASDAVRAGFANRCAPRGLVVIDPDADEQCSTIEHAAAVLDHIAAGRPKVLVVDSLQTARCAAADRAESARERMDAKVALLKSIAKRGVLVVAISEMARGGYRSGDRKTDVSALAASKESGSIEYAGAVLLGLRSVKGQPGVVDVEVAKNRLGGSKPDFRLSLDFERARFVEVDVPAPEDRRQSTEEDRAAAARVRVLNAVRRSPTLASANAISRAAGGTKADNLAMVRELIDDGTLVRVGRAFRVAPQTEGNT